MVWEDTPVPFSFFNESNRDPRVEMAEVQLRWGMGKENHKHYKRVGTGSPSRKLDREDEIPVYQMCIKYVTFQADMGFRILPLTF